VNRTDRDERDGRETADERRRSYDSDLQIAYGLYPETASVASDESAIAALQPVANPDDPIGQRPPADARGPRPGPDARGSVGRVAIVQGQVYLVGVILIAQLFLITTALFKLLSGQTQLLWWLAAAQLVGFLVALLITLWPRQHVKGY
jgi:hypothetical protein